MIRSAFFVLAFASLGPLQTSAQSVTLAPVADATLYESTTALSNGGGEHLFAGVTSRNAAKRRALLRFDLGSLPAGATVDSVRLVLRLTRTISGSAEVTMHRVTRSWGEGSVRASGNEGGGAIAATGDATWATAQLGSVNWLQEGGDFLPSPSASASVGASLTAYTWRGDALRGDVEAWLSNPADNFGWILVGDESTGGTAKRFASRENGSSASRPLLEVFFQVNQAPEVVASPADVTLSVGGDALELDLAGVFSDPDGDPLSFSVSVNDPTVVSGAVSGSILRVEALATGSTTVQVSATDDRGARASAVFTVTVPSGVRVEEVPREEPLAFSLYPNPTANAVRVQIQASAGESVKLEMFDLTGRRVRALTVGEGEVGLFVADLPPGLYLIRVEAGGETETRTLVKS